MKQIKNSKIIALMILQSMVIPLLAVSWGSFDRHHALGFLVANMVWQIFSLSTLFGYVSSGECSIKEQ